ncbi:PAS domain S-box protein [Chloroflexota bacterium]
MAQNLMKTSYSSNKGEIRIQQEELLRLKAANEELQERIAVIERKERQLAALNTISGLTSQSMEIRDVLTLTANNIMAIMDADAILVFLLDDEAGELVLELYEGVSEQFVTGAKRVRLGEGFNGTVALTEEPMIIDDVTTSPLLTREAVVIEGIKSQLIVPLKSKGRVIGTLCAAKHVVAKFEPNEVELLNSIGNHIGANLGNARLYQDMKRALSRLQRSEERYRDLFENASDAIWVHDFEKKTVAANNACERVTGYSADELMNMNVYKMMTMASRLCVQEIEASLLRDEPVDPRCEVELVRKGGGKAIVEVTTSLVDHEGQVTWFQHAARDVTDEREMQENLRYYLQQVTRAQEEERKRIARELHDETLQNLIVISRQLEKISSSDALWEESLEVVRGLKKQIEASVKGIRRFSHDLRPSVLDDLGLLPALELLVDDLEKLGIAADFKVIGETRRLQPEVEVMLFRIAQEAVRNIWRHARASSAELSIEFSIGKLSMSIKDNGKGFKLPYRPRGLAGQGKLGLAGMNERAKLLGGTLMLQSEPGYGTVVVFDLNTDGTHLRPN